MSLSYLSGIDIGKSKDKGKKEKKEKKKHKVAKVTLAASRGAMLTVIELNVLKIATKLARVWQKPGGKEKLQSWWTKFGGDFAKLKKAIAKGSKQQISGERIGIAVETLTATALPIIIALVPIIKEFKAGGDASETSEFDAGMGEAESEMNSNPDFTKGTASLPDGTKIAVKPGKKGESDDSTLGSFFSPFGFYANAIFLIMASGFSNRFNPFSLLGIVMGIIDMYLFLGFIFGFFVQINPEKKYWFRSFVYLPFRIANFLGYGKEKR